MKKYRFVLLCLLVVLVIGSGAVIKRTLLRDERVELVWKYRGTYTVEVEAVSEEMSDMFFEGMLLLLDDQTSAGDVTKVEKRPADEPGYYDLTLSVSVAAYGTDEQGPGECRFTRDNKVRFISRFIDFDGTITGLTEEG